MTTQPAGAPAERSPSVVTGEEPEPMLRLEDPVTGGGISETLEQTLLSMGVPDATVESAKTRTLQHLSPRERVASRLRRTLAAVAGH